MNSDQRDLIDQLQQKVNHVFKDVLDKDTISPNEDVTQNVSNMIRVQRSLSWLQRAGELGERSDPDVTFILSWISFESLYGQVKKNGFDESTPTNRKIMEYLHRLETIQYDRKRVSDALKFVFPEIKNLFGNPFIDNGAWQKYYDHHSRSGKFSNPFEHKPALVKQSDLAQVEKTNKLLQELFKRLFLLRNQLFHGNATLKGADTERASQVIYGSKVVQHLVPHFIWIMLDQMEHYPESDKWGTIPYPRISQA